MTSKAPFYHFKSARLEYYNATDDGDYKYLIEEINLDVASLSGSSPKLLQPRLVDVHNTSEKCVVDKCLLRAVIVNHECINIGIVSLKAIPPELAHHRCTEVHIYIGNKYRGLGYGAEATTWATWYAFQMAGMHRIQVSIPSFNTPATKLFEGLGFAEEGRQRSSIWFNGQWHDNVLYGVLKNEFRDWLETDSRFSYILGDLNNDSLLDGDF